jgi:GGDEF domain-containing protein
MRELLARAQALVRHNRRERDRSATTDLPGPAALDTAIADWLEDGQPFALLFAEAPGFDRFVGEQGWVKGGELVASLADGLRAAVQKFESAVLTHLGADDFVILSSIATAPALAEAVKQLGTHRLSGSGLSLEVVSVDVSDARTTDEVARAVARARQRRPSR